MPKRLFFFWRWQKLPYNYGVGGGQIWPNQKTQLLKNAQFFGPIFFPLVLRAINCVFVFGEIPNKSWRVGASKTWFKKGCQFVYIFLYKLIQFILFYSACVRNWCHITEGNICTPLSSSWLVWTVVGCQKQWCGSALILCGSESIKFGQCGSGSRAKKH